MQAIWDNKREPVGARDNRTRIFGWAGWPTEWLPNPRALASSATRSVLAMIVLETSSKYLSNLHKTRRNILNTSIMILTGLSISACNSPNKSMIKSCSLNIDKINLNSVEDFRRVVESAIPIGVDESCISSILPSQKFKLYYREVGPRKITEVFREAPGRLKNIVMLNYDTRQITIEIESGKVTRRTAI
jgi:hypothetical protein